jgi:uncharacterized membrane protein YdbT with pleckstrin-like domain
MPDNQKVNVSRAATPLPLLPGEQLIFLTRPNFVVMAGFVLSVLLVGAAFLYLLISTKAISVLSNFISPVVSISIYVAVFFIIGIIIFLSWLNTEYVLTNRRVEMRFGIIGSGTVSIALDKIQNIAVSIGVIGFILNFGTVKIEPAGLTQSISFSNIQSANLRAQQISEAMSQ